MYKQTNKIQNGIGTLITSYHFTCMKIMLCYHYCYLWIFFIMRKSERMWIRGEPWRKRKNTSRRYWGKGRETFSKEVTLCTKACWHDVVCSISPRSATIERQSLGSNPVLLLQDISPQLCVQTLTYTVLSAS